MASSYKILGQSRPADTNVAVLYTVPAGGQAVVSNIAIANVTTSNKTFDVYVLKSSGTASEDTAIAFGTTVLANSTTMLTVGLTLGPGEKIAIKSGTASAVTFTASGLEIA